MNTEPTAGHDYGILGADAGRLVVEFHRVAYDVELAAQAIEATDMPAEYAEMLRAGIG